MGVTDKRSDFLPRHRNDMHPSRSSLLAYCDGEGRKAARRRLAEHLASCPGCLEGLRSVQRERMELSAGCTQPGNAAVPAKVDGLLAAIARWRSDVTGAAALRRRVRSQIENYFGSQALLVVEDGTMSAEQLLGKTNELLNVFLGQPAAESIQDEMVGGMDSAWR